jgi:hypothetical protein
VNIPTSPMEKYQIHNTHETEVAKLFCCVNNKRIGKNGWGAT